jgi:transposase-like protein
LDFDEVKTFGKEIIDEQKNNPEYFITDNGSNLKEAIELLGIAHHKDLDIH